jgi:hypothetical protein
MNNTRLTEFKNKYQTALNAYDPNPTEEAWKDVVGFEGIYIVSNYGEIKSVDRYDKFGKFIKGKTRKQQVNAWGYFSIILCDDNRRKQLLAHRVVAEAFISNPLGLPEINHKDENKQNNRVENLEWCDRTYNANYGTCAERSGISSGRPVIQKTLCGEFVQQYPSVSHAARAMNVSQQSISNVVRKLPSKKTVCGYVWEYAQEAR